MKQMNKKEYQKLAEEKVPKPTYLKNTIFAFLVGGSICLIGEIISNYLFNKGIDEKTVASTVSVSLILIGALLTGLGVYDKIGKIGGAGAAIPITGFSNAVVSPAMEFKTEGFLFGVAAKMFIIAGPVLVYGIGGSVIVGIIYLLLGGN